MCVSYKLQLTWLRINSEVSGDKGGWEEAIAKLSLTSPPVLITEKKGGGSITGHTHHSSPVIQDSDDLSSSE